VLDTASPLSAHGHGRADRRPGGGTPARRSRRPSTGTSSGSSCSGTRSLWTGSSPLISTRPAQHGGGV